MAMLRKEFRIVLPMSVEEYHAAQLWSVAEASKDETGGGEGIEVVNNEPLEEDGRTVQYTKKIYHFRSRVPLFLRMLAPAGSLEFLEEAWNAYPHIKTVVTNPSYMKDGFELRIESMHLPDLGESENVHNLPEKEWKNTEVIKIDIANDYVSSGDYKAEFDPSKFRSIKANRGPFGPHWIDQLRAERMMQDTDKPPTAYMCAYKLVSCRFKWFGLQTRVENMIQRQEQRLFTTFHRQVVCWMDKWYGLTMDDIRRLEDETKQELDEMRKAGDIRGMVVQEN